MKYLPAILMTLLATADAAAATPNLAAIRPTGGRRGTEVEFVFSGARLGDAQEILYYQPGVQTVSLTKIDDNSVKAKLKLAADAPLGLHDIRVRTATGISELKSFSVGNLKEINEVEPNNDFKAPQPIDMNVTVNGVADNEDVDYFVIDAKKGDRISVEVEGIRLGITEFDPYVAILNTKRFELASNDDAALVYRDGFTSALAPEDGKYVIQVRESAYAGNGSCLYRLHVGNFPRASAIVPAGGKPGETVSIRWIGDPAGEATTKVALPAKFEYDFGLTRSDDKGFSPYPNAFRLTDLGNTIEVEPNDDQKTATPFTAPMAVNGVIEKPGDVDQFVFKAEKGQVLDIHCYARRLRSPLDPVMYLGKKGGGAAVGADDAVGPDSYFRYTVPETAEYVIWLHDQLNKGAADYFYRIEVTPATPLLSISPPPEYIMLGTGVMALAVPKGNRQAILLNSSRQSFGGELNLAVAGLPEGVAVEAPVLAASQVTLPVLFTAKPDAKLAGKLTDVTGAPTDPKVKVPSEFTQMSVLVIGPNNVNVWNRVQDKLAVSVVEECPYTVEIVEPRVPLVRSGSMGLKVKAIRKPGFKAAISLSMPWLPPGVSAGGGIVIPEGKDEAVIPLNADGGAELRTWKVVVNGASSVASGPITVSTQLANLTVAAPYVGLAFQAGSVEQGKEVDLPVKVTKNVDFPGKAQVTLLGLPNKATTEVKEITKDSTDLTYHIKTDKATPVGNHTSLFCQVVVTQNGEPIVHNIGGTALRVDAPLPPKPNAPAAAPAAAPKPAPAAAVAAKPPTRLEKLRLETKERAQAAAAAAKKPGT